jgi:hypothetical protein
LLTCSTLTLCCLVNKMNLRFEPRLFMVWRIYNIEDQVYLLLVI